VSASEYDKGKNYQWKVKKVNSAFGFYSYLCATFMKIAFSCSQMNIFEVENQSAYAGSLCVLQTGFF